MTTESVKNKFGPAVTSVIVLMYISALSGLVGGITGVKRYRSSTLNGTEIVRYELWERSAVLIVSLVAAAAAYGCTKKKTFGWTLAGGLMLALIVADLWGIVRILAISWSSAPLALWWTIQGVALGFVFRWWLRQKSLFLPPKNPSPPGA